MMCADEDEGRRRLVWLGDKYEEAIWAAVWVVTSSGGGELELGLDGDGESSSGGEFMGVFEFECQLVWALVFAFRFFFLL